MGCPQSKPELEEDRTYSDNQTLDRDTPAPLSQPGRGPPSASKPMTNTTRVTGLGIYLTSWKRVGFPQRTRTAS